MEYQCSHGNAQNMLKLQVSLHPDIAIYVWPCVASVNQNMSDLRLLVIQFKSTCIDFHQFSVNAWEYSGSIVTSLSRLDNKLDHCILSVIPSMWLSYWIMNIHIHVISLSSTESGKGNQLFSLQMHAPGRSCVQNKSNQPLTWHQVNNFSFNFNLTLIPLKKFEKVGSCKHNMQLGITKKQSLSSSDSQIQ